MSERVRGARVGERVQLILGGNANPPRASSPLGVAVKLTDRLLTANEVGDRLGVLAGSRFGNRRREEPIGPRPGPWRRAAWVRRSELPSHGYSDREERNHAHQSDCAEDNGVLAAHLTGASSALPLPHMHLFPAEVPLQTGAFDHDRSGEKT